MKEVDQNTGIDLLPERSKENLLKLQNNMRKPPAARTPGGRRWWWVIGHVCGRLKPQRRSG